MNFPTSHSDLRRGFSLIEVLLAVAILSLLILGIHHVFHATSRTVGSGQAIVATARESRSGFSAMYNDAKGALRGDDPFLLIHSERRSAYVNEADEGADDDRDVSTADTGENVAAQPALSHYRNCRTDLLGMFVRDFQRKQTGTGSTMISPMAALDAYVVYGHLRLRNRSATAYFDPGEGDSLNNTNNYFSSTWVLGRRAMLLSDITVDVDNVQQAAIDMLNGAPLLLARGASSSGEPDARYRPIESGRHDLVRTTTADLLTRVRTLDSGSGSGWWVPMIYRFQADPTPALPIGSDGAALSTPIFLRNCRHFAVEYAGDFVSQQRDIVNIRNEPSPDGVITTQDINHVHYGRITALEPDGQLDFHLVPSGQGNEKLERIRFYGFPREVDGRPGLYGAGSSVHQLTDVVPFRDVARTYAANFAAANWERQLPAAVSDYEQPRSLGQGAVYTCVFGPGDPRPSMLRIVVTLEDPDGRMGVGMSHEYVLQLGR